MLRKREIGKVALCSRAILFVVSLFLVQGSWAQNDWRLKVNDGWYNTYGSRGLQIGDTMPDIPLGKVLNNYTGKTRFSQFRGKLVILDFWGTYCESCIENFPYLTKLQEEFGDKIQIILVDSYESEKEINEQMKKTPSIKEMMPDLPSIVADSSHTNLKNNKGSSILGTLFPSRGAGNHVWIDGNGIIRLIGGHRNTYSEKIRALLNGEQIYVEQNTTIPSLGMDKSTPYYRELGYLKRTPIVFGSFITPFNNELNGEEGTRNDFVDSSAGASIHYFINQSLLDIYVAALPKAKFIDQMDNDRIIYSPGSWLDWVVFPKDIDTLSYSDRFYLYDNRKEFDKDEIKSRVCYEQVMPLSLPEDRRLGYMLDDLNRYSNNRYGISAQLETRKTPYYALIISDSAKCKWRTGDGVRSVQVKKAGKWYMRYDENPASAIENNIRSKNTSLDSLLRIDKAAGGPFMIVNETGQGSDRIMEMALPSEGVNTIEGLNESLQLYGLKIVRKEAEINFLVFKKVD